MKKMKRTVLSWMLVFAMILSGVALPQGQQVKAAGTSYNLSVSEGASPLTLAKNQWGDDYIADILFQVPDVIADKSKVQAAKPVVQVTMKINSISSDTGSIHAMLYAQDSSYNWNNSKAVDVSAGKEITVSYDLSSMSWKETTLAKLGIRFADDAVNTSSISYTITSATVTVNSSDSGSTGGSEGGTTADGLDAGAREDASRYSAEVTPHPHDQWYSEYTFSITNHTPSAVSKVQMVLPTSAEPENFQSFESINVVYNKTVGGLIVYYAGEIGAGATVTIGGKVGFKPSSVTLGTPYVRAVNCNPPKGEGTSAGELKYNLTGQLKDTPYAETPVGKHGRLHLAKVDGYGNAPVIVDQYGKPFQMRGASTHGVQWFPEYINKGAMQTLRDEWGVNLLRMACYVTQYNGYTQGGQSLIDSKIVEGVQAAKELGMYVIVDWHIHEENPHTTKTVAEQFFKKYATLYKDYDNVIFEICNEPTGVQWYTGGNDLYSYCKDIAGIIRDCGSKALIVCGTNNWSQDVEDVAKKPLKDDGFKDIMYTFHFYSGTHYEDKRQKVRTAVAAGTPIFVTEFGICDASGNGGYDTANADEWIEFLDSMNISYACWSFCNKGESASYLKTSCNKTTGGFEESDLTTTGIWLVNTYRAHQEAEEGTDTETTASPSPSEAATEEPTAAPTKAPTAKPTVKPTAAPTKAPTAKPTVKPTAAPTKAPTAKPTVKPTAAPTKAPTAKPTVKPTAAPTKAPTAKPTAVPTKAPTAKPTVKPTAVPTKAPTAKPTVKPTAAPTKAPTAAPTKAPTAKPTVKPTAAPTKAPTAEPTIVPSAVPTQEPNETDSPVPAPTPSQTPVPTQTPLPTTAPSPSVSEVPTDSPSPAPSAEPSQTPAPTAVPSQTPTPTGTTVPTTEPTTEPTVVPTAVPTKVPTAEPTVVPTKAPTVKPTVKPTAVPTKAPTTAPTVEPTKAPTTEPTVKPTVVPTKAPTAEPTVKPTAEPTIVPTEEPTPGVSETPVPTPGTSETPAPTPGVSETPVPTPGTSGTPAPTVTPSTTPSPDKTPGASATPTPSGTTPGAGTGVTPQPSQSDTGLDDEDSTASSVKLRLAKKKLTIKRGKKKRIVVKVKVPGDKVKKYKVISGKKFVKVNAKGVVIAKKKGKATIKVIMKSGASAKCKVVVKK
jgi:aryl-phospho-beta-D-glucosidase BglC (GH1 family)